MNLRPSIIKTLAFFGIFSRPLTFLELQRYLWTKEAVGLGELKESLKSLQEVKEASGFFFLLEENKDLADKRLHQEFISKRKMLLAKRAARLLSWVPFIKLVALCNSVSFGSAGEDSDIDLFIIVKGGRIWTARLLVVLTLKVFGLYRHVGRAKDKICSSFFLSDADLNLEKIILKETPDIYLIFWITKLIPLINRDKTLENFWEKNGWVKKYLANFDFTGRAFDKNELIFSKLDNGFRLFLENILIGWLGEIKENFCRFLEMKKISRKRNFNRPVSTAVIINDQMLKFHEEDRRIIFKNAWQDRIKKYGLAED